MSTTITREPVAQVIATLDRPEFQEQLRQALPPSVSLERFVRTTKLAVQLNPEIVEVADRQSLFLAMVRCAKDGLLPDNREAALVRVKVKGKDTVAYWPMVGGLRKIAALHGFAIEAHAVYSNDRFEWELGFNPSVVHVPPGLDEERGTLMGAYAVATASDGQKFLEVMTRSEVESVRAVSRAGESEFGPWMKWPSEMYRKTVARRLFKQLPLGDLEEHEVRLVLPSEAAEIEIASAPVPELAGLPTIDISEPEPDENGDEGPDAA